MIILSFLKRCRNLLYSYLISIYIKSKKGRNFIEFPIKIINPQLLRLGKNVSIGQYSWINMKDYFKSGKPTLSIGDNCYIGRFTQINAWYDVQIEENVLIADRVFISDADHFYNDISKPIIDQGDFYKASIYVKSGAWIGIGSVILPGVTIGKNSIIAANSVVTKDVPDFTIYAGIPAKFLKKITNETNK